MNDDLGSALDDLLTDLTHDAALPAATAARVARRRRAKLAGAGVLGTGAAAAVVSIGLLLAGPGAGDDRLVVPADRPAPTTQPSTGPAPEPSPGPSPATTPAATPSPPAPLPSEAAGAVRVVLRPDGLGVTDGSASTSAIEFGTDAGSVRGAVDRALGAGGEMPTPDCGPGSSTVQHEGLFLLLQDGRFVGWVTGSPGLATGDGIGVGSTLADLQSSFGRLQLSEGTVGVEWTTGEGGVSGFLDGTDPDSRVINMSAGVRCIAR